MTKKIIQICNPKEIPFDQFVKRRRAYGKDPKTDFLNISGGFQARLGQTMIKKDIIIILNPGELVNMLMKLKSLSI